MHRMPYLYRSFSAKEPYISGSSAENDWELKASYGSSPPCTLIPTRALCCLIWEMLSVCCSGLYACCSVNVLCCNTLQRTSHLRDVICVSQCVLRVLQYVLRVLQCVLRVLQCVLRVLQCVLRVLQCVLRVLQCKCVTLQHTATHISFERCYDSAFLIGVGKKMNDL